MQHRLYIVFILRTKTTTPRQTYWAIELEMEKKSENQSNNKLKRNKCNNVTRADCYATATGMLRHRCENKKSEQLDNLTISQLILDGARPVSTRDLPIKKHFLTVCALAFQIYFVTLQTNNT